MFQSSTLQSTENAHKVQQFIKKNYCYYVMEALRNIFENFTLITQLYVVKLYNCIYSFNINYKQKTLLPLLLLLMSHQKENFNYQKIFFPYVVGIKFNGIIDRVKLIFLKLYSCWSYVSDLNLLTVSVCMSIKNIVIAVSEG